MIKARAPQVDYGRIPPAPDSLTGKGLRTWSDLTHAHEFAPDEIGLLEAYCMSLNELDERGEKYHNEQFQEPWQRLYVDAKERYSELSDELKLQGRPRRPGAPSFMQELTKRREGDRS
jgi:hypothetical protein